jgi:cytochrome c oxidase assembly protein subunit 15
MTKSDIRKNRLLYYWLLLCVLMVAVMVPLGGVTRLTESGLSIVDWRPVTGTLPPLSDAAWQVEFDKYQTSPQFQQVNHDISPQEFRKIFLMEWAHRLWGRLIFLAYLLPFVVFWWRGWLSTQQKRWYGALVILVPIQGLMGWLMVQSGLMDEPRVSPLRLAVHLGLALLLFSLTLWQAWKLRSVAADSASKSVPTGLNALSRLMLFLLLLTTLAGALVAGNRAGWVYNEFPLMGGQWLPAEYGALQPWWQNFISNHAAVQFHHRWLGMATVVLALTQWGVFAMRQGVAKPLRRAVAMVAMLALLQSALGISTLLLGVPIWLAAVHQVNILALLAATLWLRWQCTECQTARIGA